jgi:hypothetical protein
MHTRLRDINFFNDKLNTQEYEDLAPIITKLSMMDILHPTVNQLISNTHGFFFSGLISKSF